MPEIKLEFREWTARAALDTRCKDHICYFCIHSDKQKEVFTYQPCNHCYHFDDDFGICFFKQEENHIPGDGKKDE